ncbi:MAG: hypothetical protein ACXVCM_12995 [Ktedonobacteraceae bacterium]
MHNSEQELHNSHVSSGERPDLAWQETTDLFPEDEAEGGTEIAIFPMKMEAFTPASSLHKN